METNETETDLPKTDLAKKDLAKKEETALAAQPVNPLMPIILAASTNGEVDADKLLKLIEAAERIDETIARKAFIEAMAQFQADAPRLVKDAMGHNSSYAKLPTVIAIIAPKESECGLSHSWAISQDETGIKVTCKITHVAGHCEETALSANLDKSGNKSDIHALGSTVTYLKRYTLEAALGLAEADDDGNGAGKDPKDIPGPTDEEQKRLDAMCDAMEFFVPDGMTLDRDRVKVVVWARAKQYPPENKTAESCAKWLVDILDKDNSWETVCQKP